MFPKMLCRGLPLLRRYLNLSVLEKPSKYLEPTRISTLPNGIRVATETLPGCETATVGVWIDAGSRFEDDRTNGTAHFLEHIIFKGTNKRSQKDIELEIENIGGHLNAYTSREQTAFYAQVMRRDIPQALDILSDILQNSKLDPLAIERERPVILREQEEVNKQMEEVVFDHLHSIAYQGSALGRTILGPDDNIRKITKENLEAYIKANYVGPRMVLSAAGAVDHDELLNVASNLFKNIPMIPGEAAKWWASPSPTIYTGSELRMLDTTMPHAHIAIAVQGASWTSPDYFPLLVAQSIVGSWNRGLAGGAQLSSRLAQVVAENDLALSFQSFNISYTDSGLFGIYCVSDHIHDLDDLVYEIQQEWVRLCLKADDTEVARAKQQLKSAVLLTLDGTNALADDIGRQVLLYGKRYGWAEMHAMIDAVDTAMVRRVASEYLYDRCPAVVGIGQIGSLPDYNRIRAATLWHRN
jgi:mitochondrial-processing peptidase subunit beta